FMESVMWAFKQLHDKGLIYEGYKVVPYCWECETPLSNSETRLDDATRERQDPAVTVWFELEDGRRILVWTTTPWTLPSNLALAVGPDIDYAEFTDADANRYLVGAALAENYAQQLAGAERTGTVRGAELVGLSYTPLFPYFADTENAFVVLAGDFVSIDEGTGTVHIAPGFGEDDQRICEENGIATVVPVNDRGRFTDEVVDFAGQQVFEANREITRVLRDRGHLVRHDSIVHNYPHCWRTDTPLIYRAVGAWFVDVQAVKERALELNQEINWVPDHVKNGAFGTWLANARDWNISRNRFWGSPIPVWKSDDPAYPRVDVYGSIDELERDFGVRPDDLHRPAIDELVRRNPDDPTGQSTMRRVEQVLDCWFESGSMPYAQVHYPFDNHEWFDGHHPADFIVEYMGQTRAWFYNLHILASALFDRPPFLNCVVHGVLLGDDGQKLSKKLRNFPDPNEVFNTIGADAMRWAFLSSATLRGLDLIVDKDSFVEARRNVLSPLWNTWSFFALYANASGTTGSWRTDSQHLLDRYVLAKTRTLVVTVGERMDAYDISGASAAIDDFLDALTNWYVRRSRDRFWEGDQAAIDTLYTVLATLCRVAAPLLPMVTERIYRDLTGERSVHLTDWPAAEELPADDDLVRAMDEVRTVCSAASSVRKAQNLRVRLPLASLTVAGREVGALEPFADLLADEVNVKEVRFAPDTTDFADLLLSVEFRVAAPRLGPATQQVAAAAKKGDWQLNRDGSVTVAGHALEPGEFTLKLTPRDPDRMRALPGNEGLVVLDTDVTPELAAEGLARDVVRLVQVARKEEGLQVTDRIHVAISAPADVREAVQRHRDYVMGEVLAKELVTVDGPLTEVRRGELPDGRAVHIGVSKLG
ncbi:MAG: isoleucine--tRNA ligase, partial [Acidimicrobiia bacterium]